MESQILQEKSFAYSLGQLAFHNKQINFPAADNNLLDICQGYSMAYAILIHHAWLRGFRNASKRFYNAKPEIHEEAQVLQD